MLDSIKIEIGMWPLFTKNLIPINETNANGTCLWKKYYLGNGRNDHNLIVRHVPSKKIIEIKGSLRKWYFGNRSLDDLNYEQLTQCLKELAFCLDIPYGHFLTSSKVLRFEIGKNINARVSASQFFLALKLLNNHRRSEYIGSSVSFFGSGIKVSFYDKLKAMCIQDGFKKSLERQIKKAGHHIIRYELSRLAPSQLGKLGYRGEKINSLDDIMFDYDKLVRLWKNQFEKIRTSSRRTNHAQFDFSALKLKKEFRDFLVYVGIQELDMRYTFHSLKLTRIQSSSKTALRKEIAKIDKAFSDKKSFDFIGRYKRIINDTAEEEIKQYNKYLDS